MAETEVSNEPIEEPPMQDQGSANQKIDVLNSGHRVLTLLTAYNFGYFMRYVRPAFDLLILEFRHRDKIKVIEDEKFLAIRETYYVLYSKGMASKLVVGLVIPSLALIVSLYIITRNIIKKRGGVARWFQLLSILSSLLLLNLLNYPAAVFLKNSSTSNRTNPFDATESSTTLSTFNILSVSIILKVSLLVITTVLECYIEARILTTGSAKLESKIASESKKKD